MTIQQNIQIVRQHIATIAKDCGRDPKEVLLLAVSKTKPVSAIQQAIDAGQTLFGENYVQEGVDKINFFKSSALQWHFIGPLQSNKTRLVAEHFDWVHTIDRLKIASRLSEQRPASLAKLNVLIQINISGEQSKSGISLSQLDELAHQVNQLPNLQLRGLMAIPAPETDSAKQLLVCQQMHDAFLHLKSHYPALDTLSLGMSDDMQAAILSGSTMVRIGTAIFGAREYSASITQGEM